MELPFDIPPDPLQLKLQEEELLRQSTTKVTQEPLPSESDSSFGERRPSIETRLASVIGERIRKSETVAPISPESISEQQLEAKIMIRTEKDMVPVEANFVYSKQELPATSPMTPAKEKTEDSSAFSTAAAWLTGTLTGSDTNLDKRILIMPDGIKG